MRPPKSFGRLLSHFTSPVVTSAQMRAPSWPRPNTSFPSVEGVDLGPALRVPPGFPTRADQRTLPVLASRANIRAAPSRSPIVKMRSPANETLEKPAPSPFFFQTRVGPPLGHFRSRPVSEDRPSRSGPRHWFQPRRGSCGAAFPTTCSFSCAASVASEANRAALTAPRRGVARSFMTRRIGDCRRYRPDRALKKRERARGSLSLSSCPPRRTRQLINYWL